MISIRSNIRPHCFLMNKDQILINNDECIKGKKKRRKHISWKGFALQPLVVVQGIQILQNYFGFFQPLFVQDSENVFHGNCIMFVLLRKKSENVPLINNCSLEQSRKQDHYFQLTDFSRSRIITKEILHKRLWENFIYSKEGNLCLCGNEKQ